MSITSKKIASALELLKPEAWGWFGTVSSEPGVWWKIDFREVKYPDEVRHSMTLNSEALRDLTPSEVKNLMWDIMARERWQLPGTVDRPDMVNHPPHYKIGGVEVIELTEQMNFCRGNAIKYIARAGLKDPEKELEDLRKAEWYLQREIQRLEPTATTLKWSTAL